MPGATAPSTRTWSQDELLIASSVAVARGGPRLEAVSLAICGGAAPVPVDLSGPARNPTPIPIEKPTASPVILSSCRLTIEFSCLEEKRLDGSIVPDFPAAARDRFKSVSTAYVIYHSDVHQIEATNARRMADDRCG
jgi:hypothetical protein